MVDKTTEPDDAELGMMLLAQKKRRKRAIIIAAVAVVVVVAAVIAVLFARGVLTPSNAAAKYNMASYVYEDDVTEYIQTYKANMGYEDASDEDWATYLADSGLTPESLRAATIKQLAIDQIVQEKAKSLGITVSDDEVQACIDKLKETYAFNDDDIWADTLEQYGTDEQSVWDTYYLQLLKNKLCEHEVEQTTPSDDELLTYTKTFAQSLSSDEVTTKHTYCFKLSQDTDGTLINSTIATNAHDALAAMDSVDVETFATVVTTYSDDDDLVASTGANGWDIDSSSYSQTYLNYLEDMNVGDLSDIFTDEDGNYCFFMVDSEYTFPQSTDELNALTLDSIPSSLKNYLSDSCAYATWSDNCDTYLQNLPSEANLVIFTMPSGLPYDVDMSLAQTDTEDSDSSDTSSSSQGETSTEQSGS